MCVCVCAGVDPCVLCRLIVEVQLDKYADIHRYLSLPRALDT